MSKKTARVSEGVVYTPELGGGGIRLDSAAWFSWLEKTTTRSFSYPLFDGKRGYIIGFMTVRKEARRRGGQYWCVYCRHGGQVRKRYLGVSSRVTSAGLEQVACSLLRERGPPERQEGSGRKGHND